MTGYACQTRHFILAYQEYLNIETHNRLVHSAIKQGVSAKASLWKKVDTQEFIVTKQIAESRNLIIMSIVADTTYHTATTSFK